MSEQIKRKEVYENDLLTPLINEIKRGEEEMKKFDAQLEVVAKNLKTTIPQGVKLTVEQMEKLNKAESESIKLANQKKKNTDNLNTLEKERLKLEKQLETAQAKKLIAEKEENKEILKLKEETKKLNKETREKIKNDNDSTNAYKKLVNETRAYKNQSKELGAELLKLEQTVGKSNPKYKELATQYARVTANAQRGDVQLKKLDKTVGDNFRNVGNYSSAVGKLNNVLGSLGIAFGAGAIVSGINSFSSSLSKATSQARTLFEVSEEGGRQIAKDATLIAKAYDKDVNEVLRSANVLQRQFNLTTEQSFNALEKGFEKGADVSGEYLENISEYATQLELAGLNAEQSISLLTQSYQQGVFSDKGVDSIKEATIALREMTDPAKGALKAIGLSADKVQQELESGTKTYFEVIQEISAQTKLVGEDTQAAGMVLADIFKGAGEDAGSFIFELDNLNLSLDNLEDTQSDYEKSTIAITKSFNEFLFGIEEGTGFLDKLSGVLNFVADNFETIVKWIGRAVVSFVAYRTALVAINAQQSIASKGIKDLVKGLFSIEKGANGGATAISGMGKALKSIVWVALISAAIELATAFYDIASGAKEARREAEELDNYTSNAAESANQRTQQRLSSLEKEIKAERQLAELALSKAKTDEERERIELDFLEKRNSLLAGNNARVQKDIEAVNSRKQGYEELLNTLNQYRFVNGEMIGANEEIAQTLRDAGYSNVQYNDTWKSINISNQDYVELTTKTRAQIEATDVKLKEYNKELSDSNERLNDSNHNLKIDSNERENNSKKIKANVKNLKDENKERKRLAFTMDEINEAINKGSKTQEEIEVEAMQRITDEYQEAHTKRLTIISDFLLEGKLTEKEANEQRLIAELDFLQERRALLHSYGESTTDIDLEIANQRVAIQKALTEDLTEEEKERLKQQEEQQKELFSLLNESQKAITDMLSKQIDERISQMDREANAAREQRQYLEGLAESGNITEEQSITEEREREIAALREKERLEKRKATLQLITSGLEVFSKELESGTDPAQALAKTVLTTGMLTDFLSNLNFFAKGTDYAPEGAAVVGEEGKEAIFDKSGALKGIFGQKGAELTKLSRGDKVLTHPETMDWIKQSAMINNVTPIKTDNAGNSYDLLTIQKLSNIEKAIQNQPSNDYDITRVAKGVLGVIKETKSGGDRRVSIHRVKY